MRFLQTIKHAATRSWRRGPARLELADLLPAEASYALVGFFRRVNPELAEELAELAVLDAPSRERAINLLPLGSRMALQAYGIAEPKYQTGHLSVTRFGADLIDAAKITSDEKLTASERRRWDETAQQHLAETLRWREEQLSQAERRHEQV